MRNLLANAVGMQVPRGARMTARRRGRAWRRGAIAGISTLVFGMAAPGASAQIAPGYSGTSGGGVVYMGDEEIWQALRVFGTCYARVNPAHALELIATEPGSEEERNAVRRAIRDPQNCFGYVSRVRAPYATLRGAVAEGLFRRRVAIPAALHRAPPARGTDSRNMHDSARCVAAAHGDRVRALLATAIGSRAEREAVAAFLSGPLWQCVPAEVGEFDMSPLMARYLLAEALLRLPPATQTAGQR